MKKKPLKKRNPFVLPAKHKKAGPIKKSNVRKKKVIIEDDDVK